MIHGATDLHFHSNRSDGRHEPAELVRIAEARGLALISLTDHDTLAGVEEATDAAEGLAVRVIPGIELSTHFEGRGLHLLAYWSEAGQTSAAFHVFLEGRMRGRQERVGQMARQLAEHRISLDVDAVLSMASGAVTRAHVGAQLIRQGVVSSPQEAFERWLGAGRPGFVPNPKLETVEAIARVRGEGGLPVVAHPGSQGVTDEELDRLVAAGLGGIEVYHPSHPRATRRRYRRACRRLGIVATGGSDYHGHPGASLLGRGHGLSAAGRAAFEDAVARARAGADPVDRC